jgi:hypothetical protein
MNVAGIGAAEKRYAAVSGFRIFSARSACANLCRLDSLHAAATFWVMSRCLGALASSMVWVLVTGLFVACGEGKAGPVVNSTDPIEFLDLRVEELSATRAVARFDTSRPTSCRAEFGTGPDELSRSATDPSMAEGELSLDHEVPLEDLLPETTYTWRAVAVDATGETYVSEKGSFTTLSGLRADGLINIALAAEGTTISGKSSNWANEADDSSFGALNAIDGKMASEWSTSGDGDDAWLELDLGQPRAIVAFGYRSRMMTDGSSIVTSTELLLDGEHRLGPFATPDHTRFYRFDFPEAVFASAVRVDARSSTGGNTGAREVQLFIEP